MFASVEVAYYCSGKIFYSPSLYETYGAIAGFI